MESISRKRAPGGYSYDDDEDYVPTKPVKYSAREDSLPVKKKKHTLDSDEEDDDGEGPGTCAGADDDDDDVDDGDVDDGAAKKYDILADEDMDGQEERTIDFEGETKITPFNMKEELEEGHFDGDGFYHFKKDGDIKDAWLEDIDWIKVKHVEDNVDKYGSDFESDEEEEGGKPSLPGNKINPTVEVYKQIFEYLKPSETVTRALKRLGASTKKISSAQKWKMKKLGQSEEDRNEKLASFLKLTELANKIIETGNMDVYEETYEMINLKIQHATAAPAQPSMDMFADENQSTSNGTEVKEDKNAPDSIAVVQWQFRWENNDDAEIHGPFTTEKMFKWQESGYFKKGVYVRKTSEIGGSWYSSKRIDFDLYI